MKRLLWLVLSALLATGCELSTPEPASPRRDAVVEVVRRVCDYQLAHPVRYRLKRRRNKSRKPYPGNEWRRATFYTGVMAAWRATGDETYRDAAEAWARKHDWTPLAPAWDANKLCCGQTYAELYLTARAGKPKQIAGCLAGAEGLLKQDRIVRKGWHWCDALFMAPPTLARLAKITGREDIRELLHTLWWRTTDRLFDADEGLFYRDERYMDRKSPNGRGVFWSRGNGWAIAGLVRVLEYLPADDPHRPRYVEQLRTMAAALAEAQQDDGLWRTSLLDPESFPDPETSGSGFFCFAIAWGVNEGVLDRATYLPVARRAWGGLVSCLDENGRLGYAQQPHYAPDGVSFEDTHEYATGAMLLTGEQMAKLEAE